MVVGGGDHGPVVGVQLATCAVGLLQLGLQIADLLPLKLLLLQPQHLVLVL